MEFHIGTPIFDRDGEKLGRLKHVIVDPVTKEVVEIVLGESGLIGRDVIVVVGAVNSADRERVDLQLNKAQTARLQNFEEVRYIAPGPDEFGDAPWAMGALMTPGMFPVGAATGVGAGGYPQMVETDVNIPEGDIDLEPGTEVWATDGKVGHVREVLADEQTKRVKGFVIESGFIFHTDVEVGLDKVANIGAERITLSVSKAELQAAT